MSVHRRLASLALRPGLTSSHVLSRRGFSNGPAIASGILHQRIRGQERVLVRQSQFRAWETTKASPESDKAKAASSDAEKGEKTETSAAKSEDSKEALDDKETKIRTPEDEAAEKDQEPPSTPVKEDSLVPEVPEYKDDGHIAVNKNESILFFDSKFSKI